MAIPSIFPTGTTIYKPEKCWNGYTLFHEIGKGRFCRGWRRVRHPDNDPERLWVGSGSGIAGQRYADSDAKLRQNNRW